MTWSRPAPVAVLVRLMVLLAGIAVILAPQPLHGAPVLITAVGALFAVVAPARIGATIASVGFVIAWTTAYGWHLSPSPVRTLTAAAALYALHMSTGLAAFVPWDARVDPAVLRRYFLRRVPVLVGAAPVIAISYALPRGSGSAFVELAGLFGVLAVPAVPIWLASRPD